MSNKYQDGGTERSNWEGCQKVIAMAYDSPIPGFNTYNTNNLRLWRSRPRNTFDFDKFNSSVIDSVIKEVMAEINQRNQSGQAFGAEPDMSHGGYDASFDLDNPSSAQNNMIDGEG